MVKSGIPQKNLVLQFAESLSDETSYKLKSILQKYDKFGIGAKLYYIEKKIDTVNEKIESFFTFDKPRYLSERELLLLEEEQLRTDLTTIMKIYNHYKNILIKHNKRKDILGEAMFFHYMRQKYGIPEFQEASDGYEIKSPLFDYSNEDKYLFSQNTPATTHLGGRRKATRHRRKQYRTKTINKNKKRKSPL